MKSLVLLAALAVSVALAAPPSGPSGPSAVADQESQASEAVSKRGAARLSPVSSNSITDNTVSSAPQHPSSQLQLQPQQPAPVSYSSLQLQPQQQQQPLGQPLYSPHPYSFVQPHPFFQYQAAPMLHSKYHVPGKQMIQYVQPYYNPFQTPLMYLIPQPQPQAHAQAHAQAQTQQAGSQTSSQPGSQTGSQTEQPAAAQQQPHYVMVLQAPAPALAPSATGFQYFNQPQLALPQPQQLITFYAGPQQHQPQLHQPQLHQSQLHQPQFHQSQLHQHQLHQPQLHQPQLHQPQLHQAQLHQPQLHQQLQPSRFYPEQQQLIYQSQQPSDASSSLNDGPPHFVQKQQSQGLEAPSAPTPASLVGSYGTRVQHQQPQHAYKTIIKA